MQKELEYLFREKFRIGYYPDELSLRNDGHNIYVSCEDLSYLNDEQKEELIELIIYLSMRKTNIWR